MGDVTSNFPAERFLGDPTYADDHGGRPDNGEDDTHYTYSHENVCWHLDWDPLDPREGALEGREASEEAKEG